MGKEVICQVVASFGRKNQVCSLLHESDTQDNRQQYFNSHVHNESYVTFLI
jgi:hypothetical protein